MHTVYRFEIVKKARLCHYLIIMSKRSGSDLQHIKPGKRVNSTSDSDDTLPADLIFEDSVDSLDILESTKIEITPDNSRPSVVEGSFDLDKMEEKISSCLQKIIFGAEFKLMLRNSFSELILPVTKDVSSLKRESEDLKNKTKDLDVRTLALEHRLDEYEQNEKNTSVIILNRWEEDKNENVSDMIMKFSAETLNFPLSPDDIVKSHRIGGGKDTNRVSTNLGSSFNRSYMRPILVKFKSLQTKNSFKKARMVMKHNATVQGIFVNDDLTRLRRNMLNSLIQLKKDKIILDCWSYNGRIMYKTRHGLIVNALSKPLVPNDDSMSN